MSSPASEVEAPPSPVPTVALGQVMAAQANFVRVKVEAVVGGGGVDAAAAPPKRRLLCVVRGLLKKIKQQVLVGDTVKVVGIDWTEGRGAHVFFLGVHARRNA
jgi:putative ribosome biogenesis GTPase RsgA